MRRTQPGSAIKLINNDGTKSFIILEWNVYGHPLERTIKLVLCKANFWHKNIDHTAGGAGTGEWLLKGKGYFLRCEVKFEAYTHFDKEAAWNTTSSSLKYSPGEDLVRCWLTPLSCSRWRIHSAMWVKSLMAHEKNPLQRPKHRRAIKQAGTSAPKSHVSDNVTLLVLLAINFFW